MTKLSAANRVSEKVIWRATWDTNSGYDDDVYGKIGVHFDGTTETIFAGVSQEYTGNGNTTPGSSTTDLTRMTFKENTLDNCRGPGCSRYTLNYWSKVISIAPLSADVCIFLVVYSTSISAGFGSSSTVWKIATVKADFALGSLEEQV